MNLKLSNQTIELDTQKLTEEDKKKLIESLEDDTWPKKGDEYWHIEGCGIIYRGEFGFYPISDTRRTSVGNIFRTEEAAQRHLTYLKALQVLKGDTKGYEWKYGDNFYYVSLWGTLNIVHEDNITSGEPVKFKTKDDARESIKLHEKEWRIVLLGEDK